MDCPHFFHRRKKSKIKCRAPGNRRDITRGIPAGCSEQTDPRHTGRSAYCCSRQGLTGFTVVRCTGPTLQRPLPAPCLTISCLKPGIQPCYSGLQVQGTAGSPSGTANFVNYYAVFPALYSKYLRRTMHSLRSGPTPIIPTAAPVSASMNSMYSLAALGSSS